MFSDLHLRANNEPFYRSFMATLSKLQFPATLVFAGDLFDVFSGANYYFFKKHADFFKKIAALVKSGNNVIFLEGNHDVHFSPALEKECGATVVRDHYIHEVAGKKFFIAHGDLVNTKDVGYLLLRSTLRSSLIRVLFSLLPGLVAEKLGMTLSGASKDMRALQKTDLANKITRRIFHDFAKQKFSEGFDFVLLGHSHDFDEMKSLDSSKQYLNSGFPPVHMQYMRWHPGEAQVSRVAFEKS